jgi:charged multivesicular body protein 2A
MAEAMKGVTKALTAMNKKISLPGLQKIMADFMRENEKAEIVQETIGDTLDDAMAEDGSAEAEDAIVSQVLDELGIGMSESVPDAPTAAAPAPAVAEASADAATAELEARLNNLRR